MKAMLLTQFDTPLELTELPVPVIKAHQVLVEVHASSVNPLDLKIKSGQAGHAKVKPPFVLGIDVAGVIVKVGAEVRDFAVGDEVYGMAGGVGENSGSLTEYQAVDASLLARKPHNITMREAAAMPLIFITAWEGLVDRAHLGPNHKVLIHGGAGGVGHMAVQLAKARGAKVFATGKADQAATISNFGATPIDYTKNSVQDYVKSATEGQGFDVVYDTVGGATLDASFEAVRKYTGHVLSCLGWGSHSLAPLSFRGATYSGVFTLLPLLSGESRAHHGKIMQEATKLVEQGLLKPLVSALTFRLQEANEAQQLAATGARDGKIVIDIRT